MTHLQVTVKPELGLYLVDSDVTLASFVKVFLSVLSDDSYEDFNDIAPTEKEIKNRKIETFDEKLSRAAELAVEKTDVPMIAEIETDLGCIRVTLGLDSEYREFCPQSSTYIQ